jgi:hypothetical protein
VFGRKRDLHDDHLGRWHGSDASPPRRWRARHRRRARARPGNSRCG